MSTLQLEREHQSSGVLIRGVLLVIAAGLAHIEPETFFLDALIGVAAVCLVFGLHELNTSRFQRTAGYDLWWLTLINSLTVATFGVTTMAMLVTSFNLAVSIVVVWLTAYAVLLGIAASALRARRIASKVLVVNGILHAAMAAVVLVLPAYPRIGILLLAELGALYVAFLGVWQIVIAASIIRELRPVNSSAAWPVEQQFEDFHAIRAVGIR